ncbi:MAG: c-type cytochrome [Paracoccus sp. (in: a-proteobacteria)]|nr:c-type cytochrome [Paracoccus sp. (in: a-proteobacteria)]
MLKFHLNAALILLAGPALAGPLGIGREAHPEEIAAWDVKVMPDGRGLPAGSGSVLDGEDLFSMHCAACHGEFAEGADNWPTLAGGEGTLAAERPVKTVGSYWPYLSTVWDYVHRSMPFGQAQTLEPDEVYAITAYILYSNYLVDDDFVLTHENFAQIEMPNADGFIIDDRPETEYPLFSVEPCMSDCTGEVRITARASDLNVTPEDSGVPVRGAEAETPAEAEAESPDEAEAEADHAEAEATEEAAADPELLAAGERAFAKCRACHMIGEGATNRVGPRLTGIIGAPFAHVDDFNFSPAIRAAADEGRVWSEDELRAFLADPRGYLPGNRMTFAGIRNEAEMDALLAYLASQN